MGLTGFLSFFGKASGKGTISCAASAGVAAAGGGDATGAAGVAAAGDDTAGTAATGAAGVAAAGGDDATGAAGVAAAGDDAAGVNGVGVAAGVAGEAPASAGTGLSASVAVLGLEGTSSTPLPSARIALPVSRPTCPAFGGPQLDVLYLTSARGGLDKDQLRDEPQAGGVFSANPGCRGLPESRFVLAR